MTKVKPPMPFIDTDERVLGDPSRKAQWSFWTFETGRAPTTANRTLGGSALFPTSGSSGTHTTVRKDVVTPCIRRPVARAYGICNSCVRVSSEDLR